MNHLPGGEFAAYPWRPVLDETAGVFYCPGWIEPALADRWFADLRDGLTWTQPEIRIFGRSVPVPRQQVWMGDEDAHYRYSGLDNRPEPWHPLVREIRDRCGPHFNSVLINLYRDGRDSNGWHSDDEKELGSEPVIASVSLGESRRFLLRRREDHKERIELVLEHGSLLLMQGRSQAEWQHTVPKQLKVTRPRINLTFRRIF